MHYCPECNKKCYCDQGPLLSAQASHNCIHCLVPPGMTPALEAGPKEARAALEAAAGEQGGTHERGGNR